jgi:hypothetical protein
MVAKAIIRYHKRHLVTHRLVANDKIFTNENCRGTRERERDIIYYFFSLGLDGLRSGCYASSENEIGEIWVL